MIIPQISENLTRSGVRDIPETCPACGGATRIQMMNNVETLYCTNPECPAKFNEGIHPVCKPRRDEHRRHVGGNARKIRGPRFIREFADIFRLDATATRLWRWTVSVKNHTRI